MLESNQDWADQIGKRVATILVALLFALLAYGYLGRFVVG